MPSFHPKHQLPVQTDSYTLEVEASNLRSGGNFPGRVSSSSCNSLGYFSYKCQGYYQLFSFFPKHKKVFLPCLWSFDNGISIPSINLFLCLVLPGRTKAKKSFSKRFGSRLN